MLCYVFIIKMNSLYLQKKKKKIETLIEIHVGPNKPAVKVSLGIGKICNSKR